jgi:hypothetical protein
MPRRLRRSPKDEQKRIVKTAKDEQREVVRRVRNAALGGTQGWGN